MFTITRDLIADPNARPGTNANAVGVAGPRGCKLSPEQIAHHPQGQKFRMKDDDGELVYEGVYVGPDDETLFQPLDCFGMPNAGCTIIEYFQGGKWTVI